MKEVDQCMAGREDNKEICAHFDAATLLDFMSGFMHPKMDTEFVLPNDTLQQQRKSLVYGARRQAAGIEFIADEWRTWNQTLALMSQREAERKGLLAERTGRTIHCPGNMRDGSLAA